MHHSQIVLTCAQITLLLIRLVISNSNETMSKEKGDPSAGDDRSEIVIDVGLNNEPAEKKHTLGRDESDLLARGVKNKMNNN